MGIEVENGACECLSQEWSRSVFNVDPIAWLNVRLPDHRWGKLDASLLRHSVNEVLVVVEVLVQERWRLDDHDVLRRNAGEKVVEDE